MNPFKSKQLNDFTIEDCEEYIRNYPYGEHISIVKKCLKDLKKVEESCVVATGYTDNDDKIPTESQTKTNMQDIDKTYTTKTDSGGKKKDIAKEIFSWIGLIVVVLVVGIIIMSVLDAILPYGWQNKYRYLIFPGLMAIGRWIQKELNW